MPNRVVALLCAGLWGLLIPAALQGAEPPQSGVAERLGALVRADQNGRSAVVVVDTSTGRTVFAHNPDLPLKPASVLKVATAAAALEYLGAEFTFRTQFWTENFVSGGVDTLTIVGGGDPDFTTEDAWLAAREIHKRGVRRIGRIQLDESQFISLQAPSGQRAYRAGSAGLPFNFNSIGFEVCPTVVGRNAVVSVDPWESGATLAGQIKTARGGRFTVDERGGWLRYQLGGSVSPGACVELYRAVDDPKMYLGRTFAELLRSVGVQVNRPPVEGRRGAGATLLYEHHSKPLVDIVRDLNHYSNNFIAEQIVLGLGMNVTGMRDRSAGLERIAAYLGRLGVPVEQVSLADGSGLSHANRLTARAVTTVLGAMHHDVAIGPEFEISLSVSGRSGTLRERRFGSDERVVRGKTGTLDGVSSLAGYVTTAAGRHLAFAVIVNEARSKDVARRFENKIVELLYEAG